MLLARDLIALVSYRKVITDKRTSVLKIEQRTRLVRSVFSPVLSNEKRRMQDDQLCWALAIIGLFAVRLIALSEIPGFSP